LSRDPVLIRRMSFPPKRYLIFEPTDADAASFLFQRINSKTFVRLVLKFCWGLFLGETLFIFGAGLRDTP